ncbi:dirigent protein 1-like [Rhodamnia argentea]|uniref:Dirigent protein n=1 Tax=Rhodamnia argentea TaxID=178133 RepID=A0A8B8QB81_9MYRT|nr:dirigent protein 1-like [Rhodamnia argentea]
MAPNAILKFATLSVLVLLAISASSEANFDFNQKLKETKLVFYMFDWETGLNITTVPVAGIPGNRWWILGFGTVFAIDDKLTESYDRNSNEVGRARGAYVNSAVDGSDLHLLMSVVFTNQEFNGSTLEIQGSDRFYNKYREVSVVSGTGKFRFARGYAFLETLLLDQVNSNAIIRWNVTVYHY